MITEIAAQGDVLNTSRQRQAVFSQRGEEHNGLIVTSPQDTF